MTMSVPFRALCLVLALAVLGGCRTSSAPTASVATSTKSTQLSLSGKPPTTATVGQSYSFTPTVSGASGTVTFSVKNAPSWASFNSGNGALTGTPKSADAGADSNIVISVSDGRSSATLSAFTINVAATGSGSGNATLSWTAPTTNTNGSTLTGLAGYRIYYGTSAGALNDVVTVSSGVTSYVFEGLTSGTWYFAVQSYSNDGISSALSNVVSTTIS